MTLSSGTVQSIVVDSATQLTVYLTGTLSTGPLYASVTTDGLTSQTVQVASIVNAATPTIATTMTSVGTDATALSISGSGFDTNSGASISVTLSSGTVIHVAAQSSTLLLVTLDPTVSLLTPGPIAATVTVDGLSSGTAQVATAAATPTITPSTAPWSANSPTLTILGAGFSSTPPTTASYCPAGRASLTPRHRHP